MSSEPYRYPLLWVDCEMTGLDPEKDEILEVACVLTDGALERMQMGPHMVLFCPEDRLHAMGPWCREQHARTGLSAACMRSDVGPREAEEAILGFLKQQGVREGQAVLAGNSVHLDRGFLQRQMPRLVSYLHYRILDVSSLKTIACAWYPDTPQPQKVNRHRAESDILESIDELKYYRTHIFRQQ